MAQRYNVSGTAYDDSGAPAQLRKVFIYERSTGRLLRQLETSVTGEFGTWIAEQVPVMVVIQPADGDTGNAKIYDNVIPNPGLIEASVNNIGIPGDWGYGQGICPNPPTTMVALDGYNDPTNPNYGNYRYSVDNSIMVWIPAFWFKMGDGTNGVVKNGISLKPISDYADDAAAAVDGYVYHRAFIDGGQRKAGFFIDKYRCNRNIALNCPSSHYGEVELTINYNSTVNAYPRWIGKTFNDFGLSASNQVRAQQVLEAAALRGDGSFNVMTNFQGVALWMIWLFQKQEAPIGTPRCRWKISQMTSYFQPRGWNNSSGSPYDSLDRNYFDFTTMNIYPSEGGLAGVCYPFEMSTHNGMACGIHGVAGGLLEMCIGVISLSTSNPNVTINGNYMLKESVKASSLRTTNYLNGNLYDNITNNNGFPPIPQANAWHTRVVSGGAIQTFNPTTDRNSNDYKYLMVAGIPTKTESIVNAYPLDGQIQWGGSIYLASSVNSFWSYGGGKNTSASVSNMSVGPGCFTMDVVGTNPKSDLGMRLSLYI